MCLKNEMETNRALSSFTANDKNDDVTRPPDSSCSNTGPQADTNGTNEATSSVKEEKRKKRNSSGHNSDNSSEESGDKARGKRSSSSHSKKHKKHKKEKKKRKHKQKHHHHRRSRSSSSSSSSSWPSSDDSDHDVSKKRKSKVAAEKDSAGPSTNSQALANSTTATSSALTTIQPGTSINDEDDEDAYGPIAPYSHSQQFSGGAIATKGGYGQHLLAGEGDALAEYIKRNERIPRRGEVGWDGEKIKQFEELGYVMSGSRHKRMEAVRKRKENQIFSAEEKRLMLINETRKREEKEAKVLEEMRHLIRKKEHEEAAGKL